MRLILVCLNNTEKYIQLILHFKFSLGEKEKEGKKSLAYSSIAEQMIKPLDRSKIRLNDTLKKDDKDIKVIYFLQ